MHVQNVLTSKRDDFRGLLIHIETYFSVAHNNHKMSFRCSAYYESHTTATFALYALFATQAE